MLFLSEKINNKSKERKQTVSPTAGFHHDSLHTLLPRAFLWSRNVVKTSPVSFQIYFQAIRWRYFRIPKHFVISSSDNQIYTLTCANRCRDMHIFGMSRSRCLMPKFCRNLKCKFLTGRGKFHFR